jgi:hypothetical protein
MSRQNIFIINFNSLYEILDEIKENLSFKIIKYDNEDSFNKASNLDLKNALFFSKFNKKLLINKDISEKNFFSYDLFPLSINSLIELINIQLIKLRFNYQSRINIKEYELNLNSKNFSKGELGIKLTEKEIEVILYLNETKAKHNVLDLQKKIWGYSPNMETHTVETHIYRLRKKISSKFNDESFILNHKDGYFIE